MNSDSAEMNNQQEEDNDDDTPSESGFWLVPKSLLLIRSNPFVLSIYFLANTELVTPNSKSTEQNSKRDSNGRRQRTYSRDADVSELGQKCYITITSQLRYTFIGNSFIA